MTAENEHLLERLRKRAEAFNDAGLRYGVADLLNEAAVSHSALLDRLRAAEARAAGAEAVIAEAPHDINCMTGGNGVYARLQGLPADCDCWKSRYRAGADQ
jgi:hypothetical protein